MGTLTLNLYGIVVEYDSAKKYGILIEPKDGKEPPYLFDDYDPSVLKSDADWMPKPMFLSSVRRTATPEKILKNLGKVRSGTGSGSISREKKEEALKNANALFKEVLAALDGSK